VSNSVVSISNRSSVYIRDLDTRIIRLVSAATNEAVSDFNMESVLPAISADGRLVAFDTDGEDLVSDDKNRAYDVFVRNVVAETTELVSIRHATRPPRMGVQSASTSFNSISADGRFVAFTSMDDPRVPFDTNRQHDIFVRDLLTGSVTRQSREATNLFVGSLHPGISANGSAVLFLRQPTFLYTGSRKLFWSSTAEGIDHEVANVFVSEYYYYPGETNYAALSPDGSTVVYPDARNLT
jgi:Tol biopolymer transport system component